MGHSVIIITPERSHRSTSMKLPFTRLEEKNGCSITRTQISAQIPSSRNVVLKVSTTYPPTYWVERPKTSKSKHISLGPHCMRPPPAVPAVYGVSEMTRKEKTKSHPRCNASVKPSCWNESSWCPDGFELFESKSLRKASRLEERTVETNISHRLKHHDFPIPTLSTIRFLIILPYQRVSCSRWTGDVGEL